MEVKTAVAQSDVAEAAGMLAEVTHTFYNSTAREWIRMSPVNESHGRKMLSRLDDEYDRFEQAPARDLRTLAYATQMNEVYKVMGDAMMSAVHRSIFQYHVNACSAGSGFHIPTDEEELQVSNDPIDDTDDEDNDSLSSIEEPAKKPAAAANPAENKARKREEAKKRRAEDDELLLKDRKVRDEKNNLMSTVGPFPPPRLTIRSLKPGRAIPSRKSLTQRAVLDTSDSSSDSDVEELKDIEPPGPSSPDVDTVAQLMAYLAPLSMDSLKKMSESAKVKWRGSCTHDEAVSDIVKAAVKMGCEKACVFMDKNKMLDKVATHANTSRAHVLAQLATSVPSFLKTLPEELLRSLGPTLGIPHDNSTVPEMWERIVAMGFCAVLTHLRPRPLKKIAQELSIQLNDTVSTEKHCEQIVFTAFPRERLRVKQSRSLKKAPGVCFRVQPERCRCQGDMGFIDFAVLNVSGMRQDNERHYSPEFEFANLRWSLLCMANKDALALYLCQQGTVHCKFIISILNSLDPDSTVYNEGTQRFSSASAENDWGFNNVVKFEYLLDPKNGFWKADQDTIEISVGIVLVEASSSGKASTSVIPNVPAVATKAANAKNSKPKERIVESVANQLLETERLENLRKKVKADLQKTQREEEKQRKDIVQKQLKAFQQVWDQHSAEKQKIVREIADRERREHQERVREQERLRQLQEQNDDLKRKLTEFTEENADLATRKKNAAAELREEKKRAEGLRAEATAAEAELAAMLAELQALEARVSEKSRENAALSDEIDDLRGKMPIAGGAHDDDMDVSGAAPLDTDILRSVQQSLAGIVDADW